MSADLSILQTDRGSARFGPHTGHHHNPARF
jgi:hypothetical protein